MPGVRSIVRVGVKEKQGRSPNNRFLNLSKKCIYLFTGFRKGKKSCRKRKFQNRRLGQGSGAVAGSDRVRAVGLALAGGHFQVVRTGLPASLCRLPLSPSDWPGRLLSSRSAPSPCASSSSYLETDGTSPGFSCSVATAAREAAHVPPNPPAQRVALAAHQGPPQAPEHRSSTLLKLSLWTGPTPCS